MAVKIGMDDVKNENDVRGGGRPDAEGFFHVIVTGVDDSQSKYEAVLVDMKLLAGTDESQAGRSYREFFGLSEKAKPRLQLFGIVTGAGRPGGAFDCEDLVGKQAIVKLERNEYEKDGETRVNFKTGWDTFHRLDDPDVAHVPRAKDVPEVSADDSKGDGGDDDWQDF